jgi:hypothetical protein
LREVNDDHRVGDEDEGDDEEVLVLCVCVVTERT